MATAVERSAEVAREEAIRRNARLLQAEVAHYRKWIADGAHKSGRMDPLVAIDGFYECAHQHLPHDRIITCSCWGPVRTPETKEAPMEEAPYGHKADGTPRKKPAPSAETLAKATAARRAKAAAKPRPATEGTSLVPSGSSLMLARMVAELDVEITRLSAARDALVKAMAG